MNDALLFVNMALLVAASCFQCALLWKTRKRYTPRRWLRWLGLAVCLFFAGVYVHGAVVGTMPGIGYIRPGLTVFFAYVLAELIYEYFSR